jgi:aminoglycoside phosphotransferase (APT) family kinase protein
VADHSLRAKALLARIVAVGGTLEADAVPSTDFAHLDFHHRNVLVADGCLTAIIDSDGCQDGDRRFDLVTLAYWLGFVGAEPGVAERLAARTVAETPLELLVAYRAHMVLRNVDFYARTGRPEVADLHVSYGESVLAALGA